MSGSSGSATMYHVKPVFTLPEQLHQTKVMYEMKRIHERGSFAADIARQAPHPEIAALELRQEKILGQLAELKKMIASLSVMVKTDQTDQTDTQTETQNDTQTIIKKEETKQDPITVNLVLKVDTTQIPYSLLALQNLWEDTHFNVSCYTHSSKVGSESSDEITTFENTLQSNKVPKSTCGLNIVNLTLIWKNVDVLEINMGLPSLCLLGETTLLRLLSRSIQSHNYEEQASSKELSLIDTILDDCYEVHLTKCPETLGEVITKLDNILSSGTTCLASTNKPTIADIAAWSVIKSHSTKKLPNNVAKWFDRCQKLFC